MFLRAFGRFNLTLWDDVFKEFLPLTDNDVIVVNFGAWYPRYNVHESGCVPCLGGNACLAAEQCRCACPLYTITPLHATSAFRKHFFVDPPLGLRECDISTSVAPW